MRTFASLKFFNYRLWFAGALVSNVGTWMQRIAQDWLVLTVLTHNSGAQVGIVTALQFVPFLIIGPYAGVLTDRVNNRKLLIATQSAAGVLGLALGAMVLTNTAELWHVYVFATLLGVVTAFDNPARQTFVTELVPASNLANAVALNSASFNAARLIGPGVAGLLIAVVGSTGWVFIINALTFGATIVVLLIMRRSELIPHERAPRRKGQIREGFRYVRRRADILVIMVIMAVVSALGFNFQLTSALMARVEFGKGAGEYGILGSVLAIGSLAGALLAARRGRPRLRVIVGAAGAFGVTSGIMARDAHLRALHLDVHPRWLLCAEPHGDGECVGADNNGAQDAWPRDVAVHDGAVWSYARGLAARGMDRGARGPAVVDPRGVDRLGARGDRGCVVVEALLEPGSVVCDASAVRAGRIWPHYVGGPERPARGCGSQTCRAEHRGRAKLIAGRPALRPAAQGVGGT